MPENGMGRTYKITMKRPITHAWQPDKFTCLHELVRIRVGSYYYSITEGLTHSKDEAMVLHPDNSKFIVFELTNKYKSEKVWLETNRV